MSGLDESELRAFEESVSTFVTKGDAGKSSPREIWQSVADLGWSSLAISEASGGLESGTSAIAIVARNLGEALLETPFISTGVVASIVLDQAQGSVKDPEHIAALLEKVTTGDVVVGVAVEELFGDPAFVQLELGGSAEKPVLDGRSAFVIDAGIADHLLVPAKQADGTIAICLVSSDADGVTIDPASSSIDGRDVRAVTFEGCRDVRCLGAPCAAIENAGIALRLALSAEAIGIMAALNKMTGEYLKVRRQFGVPLARFQVLQHRLVDMALDEQQSIALVERACNVVDAGSDDAMRMVLISRSFTAKAVRRVAEDSVQLHGGVGMTDELAIGHYLKRALVIGAMLGGIDEDLRLLSEQPQRPWFGDTAPLERTLVQPNPATV
ncbi:acyl-CoA dehydrogenase family protein [Croceicoccus sediminis]|uniref:acyl-CoA dehydrogenase family protein n=1 Tax=Croceicoccus sediminis TaxID=2571150 RepID=UPI001478E493|nr:acyl-CoA dehydrogenase family protein [Croceicoccus sediminis]